MLDLLPNLQRDVRFILANAPVLLDGFGITLLVAATSLVCAFVWALCLLIIRITPNRIVAGAALSYIEVVRNTPLLIQVFLAYFGLPLLGWNLSPFLCGVLAIAGQHGAFSAEVLRAAVHAVPGGQSEAATALGLRPLQRLRFVVLPQAFRMALPSLTGQVLLLIKDSAVVAGIGIVELTLAGKIIIERSAASYQIFVFIALAFLFLNLSITGLLRALEGRLARGARA